MDIGSLSKLIKAVNKQKQPVPETILATIVAQALPGSYLITIDIARIVLSTQEVTSDSQRFEA